MDSVTSEEIRLELPMLANWINLNQKEHWAPRNKRAQAWRHGAHMIARQNRLPKGLQRAQVDAYVWKSSRRRYDPHNLMPTLKPVVDGLVDYGLVADDDVEHLVGPFVHHGGYGSDRLVLVVRSLCS